MRRWPKRGTSLSESRCTDARLPPHARKACHDHAPLGAHVFVFVASLKPTRGGSTEGDSGKGPPPKKGAAT